VLFIGLAGAMVLPAARRSVPRWIEALIWLGLIASSWLTVTNVRGASARFLTDSLTWGLGQIVNVSIEILTTNLKGWLAINRYGIAEAVMAIAVLDIFSLAMLESQRHAKKGLPRVRLGEWFEFSPATMAEVTAQAGLVTWLVMLMRWRGNSVGIRLKARQAVAGRHPVDIRTFATADSVGPSQPSGQSSALGYSLNESRTEEASTRLAS